MLFKTFEMVGPRGIEPRPKVFQTLVPTTYTRDPLKFIVHERLSGRVEGHNQTSLQ